LVLLRLSIGWHFFKEGAKKFTDPAAFESQSRAMLVTSKGPLSGIYKGLVTDPYGRERLDYDKTRQAFEAYRDQVIATFGLNEEQQKKAGELTNDYLNQLQYFFLENEGDLDKYLIKLDAWEAAQQSNSFHLSYEQDWAGKESLELRGMAGPWLKTLGQLRDDFRRNMLIEVVGLEDPLPAKPAIADPAAMGAMNTLVKWTVILVGIFLIFGLFTRFWSVIGAGFLLTVITSQWPGWTGATPTYYQVVEMFALLVLCATAAGRYAGLDFFVDAGIKMLTRRPSVNTEESKDAA
jgi:uncharacterized membrane protein YphA (DoxX/SURF4 family)